MTIKNKLEKLAAEKSTPCISISLNTHRTFPENVLESFLIPFYIKGLTT